MNSVNRFGKIPPLWQFSLALFSIWQNVEHTLKNVSPIGLGKFSLL